MIQVTASGRIGRDAEKRFVGETSVVSFSMAVDRPKKQGQEKPDSDWYKIEMWGKRGEALCQYLTKGTKLVVQGRLEIQTFTKSDNSQGFQPTINANDIELVSRPATTQNGQQQAAPQQQQRQPVAAAAPTARSQQNDLDAIFASEDEIPF